MRLLIAISRRWMGWGSTGIGSCLSLEGWAHRLRVRASPRGGWCFPARSGIHARLAGRGHPCPLCATPTPGRRIGDWLTPVLGDKASAVVGYGTERLQLPISLAISSDVGAT